jgi:hypothetical protein
MVAHIANENRVISLKKCRTYYSRVVQCSNVLGLLLFLLSVNDIDGVLSDEKCICRLYADDLKLYTELQINEDDSLLQH